MSDIVERLAAEYQLPGRTVSKGRLLMEARAKIERLTADLDILKRHYNLHPNAPLSREETLAAKDAKIERLRALVEECLRYMHNDFEPDNQSAAYYRIRHALEATNRRDK